MVVDSFPKNIDTLNHLNVVWCKFAYFVNKSFPLILGIKKEQKDCLKSIAKKQDVFGIFINWFRQEFDVSFASLDTKRHVKLRTFYGYNCQPAGSKNEGQG